MYNCVSHCLYYVITYIVFVSPALYEAVVFVYIYLRDGEVAMSSTNGLGGIGFASRYRLQPRAGF